MIKKNWKKICVIFFFVFLNKTGVTIEDSDIFLESVYLMQLKYQIMKKQVSFWRKEKQLLI